jgi:hypothetical protein
MRRLLCFLTVALSSCVLPPPGPETIAPPPPVATPAPQPIPLMLADSSVLPAIEWPQQSQQFVSYTPPTEPVTPAKGAGRDHKPPPEPTPQQVIREAQAEARVAPTRRGYFGGRGEQRYLWSPGKIYDVYLTGGQATKLLLPPGEMLAHALMLNPKSFDVTTATVGNEVSATSVILIRPCAQGDADCVPSPDVDVALTSTTGRSYDLHLIIGKIGMVSVTWELTPITHIQTEEAGVPPRRQP